MSEKTLDPMSPEFWRNFPIKDLKELFKLGIMIPTDRPGVYYLVKEVTLPNMPEGSLPV